MQIPLFPLPICLLPGGMTQLRIFEPRYQRLVAESMRSGSGFGMCMLSDDQKDILPIGTLARIEDFETLDDGLLGIKVRGEHRFVINSMETEFDGLRQGKITLLPDWPSAQLERHDALIGDTLRTLLEQHPQHLDQYGEEDFADSSWLCQRWLEIIPVSAMDKQACIRSPDHTKALDFLRTLFNE